MALDRTTVHGCTRINAFHNYKEKRSFHLVGQLLIQGLLPMKRNYCFPWPQGTEASTEGGEEEVGVKMMYVPGSSWLLSGVFHNHKVKSFVF